MTIRAKALLTIGMMAVLFITAMIVFTHEVTLRSYIDLERSYTETNIHRLCAALEERLSKLDTTASDWAGWDDTYEFITSPNEKYIQSNLTEEGLLDIRVNAVLYFDPSGHLIIEKAINHPTGQVVEVSANLCKHFMEDSPLLQHRSITEGIKGILSLPEGQMLFTSRPILTSHKTGPIRGTLVMGCYLDQDELEDLSRITHLPADIISLSGHEHPREWENMVGDGPFKSGRGDIVALSPDLIMAYALIHDAYGKPAFMLQTELPREIYQKGVSSFVSQVLWLGAISLLFALSIHLLLNRVILSRLIVLGVSLKEIAQHRAFSTQIHVQGDDELALLTANLNNLLSSFHEARQEVIATSQDLKDALRRLEDERARTEGIIAALGDGISILDPEFRILYQNRVHIESIGDHFGKLCYEAYAKQNRICDECPIARAFQDGGIHTLEKMAVREGFTATIEIKASVLRDSKGTVIAGIEVVRDITEHRRVEEQLRSSIEEKELLIREIHHRVKNNMQVMSSLISLQAEATEDDCIEASFEDCQNRIHAMALVHEELYRSKSLEDIELGEYIRKLALALLSTYDRSSGEIELEFRASNPVSLGIDQAVPCGLIVNELVTNAIKYAFPAGRAGKISVGLEAFEEGAVELVIADNGVGIPESLDPRNTGTLGLALVADLVERQLDGTIELRRGEGTELRMRLKLGTYRKRL